MNQIFQTYNHPLKIKDMRKIITIAFNQQQINYLLLISWGNKIVYDVRIIDSYLLLFLKPQHI